jgi:hypothetical protein
MKLAPLKLRKLQAQMKLKGLRVGEVARVAGIHISTASQILNGTRIDALKLRILSQIIERSPMPPDVALI